MGAGAFQQACQRQGAERHPLRGGGQHLSPQAGWASWLCERSAAASLPAGTEGAWSPGLGNQTVRFLWADRRVLGRSEPDAQLGGAGGGAGTSADSPASWQLVTICSGNRKPQVDTEHKQFCLHNRALFFKKKF